MKSWWLATALVVGFASGCAPELVSGVFQCSDERPGCPVEMTCIDGLCVTCRPLTCAQRSAECGSLDDTCGGVLDCGDCDGALSCLSNRCECEIPDCGPDSCGIIDVGCGQRDCGDRCNTGEMCVDNTCECPSSCDGRCGVLPDGCGGVLDCTAVECAPGETCGGNDVANRCGIGECTNLPDVCAPDAECGSVEDNCSGVIACGVGCAPPFSCDAATKRCVCTPFDCAALGAECPVDDGCGSPIDCGECSGDTECSSGQCRCPLDSLEPNETLSTASDLGSIVPFVPALSDSQTLAPLSDSDFVAWDVDHSMTPTGTLSTIELEVDGLPSSGAYEVRLYAESSDSLLVPTGCGASGSRVLAPEPHCRMLSATEVSMTAMYDSVVTRIIVGIVRQPVPRPFECDNYEIGVDIMTFRDGA